MGKESDIPNALFQRLSAIVVTPALQIFYPESQSFTAPANGHIAASFLSNETERLYIGDGEVHRHQGFLTVLVVLPKGQGEIPARRIASQIVEHFIDGTKIVIPDGLVRIDKRPSVRSALIEGERLQVPVSIEWVAFI